MISSVHINPVQPLDIQHAIGTRGDASFGSFLQQAIQQADAGQTNAAKAIEGFIDGSGGDLHSTAMAVQRSALEFEYALQVRNKIVNAYQEVMRMQI